MTKSYKFILDVLKPYWLHLFFLGFIELFWAIDLSLRPYLVKVMLDRLEGYTGEIIYSLLLYPAAAYIAFSIGNAFIFRLSDFIYLKAIPIFRNQLILKSLTKIHQHPYSYFQKHFGGAIATRIGEMVDSAETLISVFIYRLLAHSLAFIIACYTIGRAVHAHLAFILIIYAIIFVYISYLLSRKPYRLSKNYLERYALLMGKLIDSINNSLSVILFGRRKYERAYIAKQAKLEAEMSQKLQWAVLVNQALTSLFLVFLIASVLVYLIYLRRWGLVTVGDFSLTLTLSLALVKNLQDIVSDFLKFSQHLGKCALAIEFIEAPPMVHKPLNAPKLNVKEGKIEFHEVCFGYEPNKLLFDNLSLVIKPQQKIGLVGYSGSGKSTFVNLIMGIFPLYSGKILIDGQDISEVNQDSLHQAISFIPQEPLLFNRSILENIAYGNLSASEEDILNAAKQAYADEFIERLPDKYHTIVGERGMKLSGGQRQRIAIARALLKNTKIFIFDEISSVLDPLTESYLQKSLDKIIQQKTVITIAHRLSTLMKMDSLLVFDKGKIVEQGTHSELLLKEGIYSQLWKTQASAFGA
ncbi:MAG: ABC transporter ATP-binding protein [Candidatus Amoebophilus sp.]